MAVTVLVVEASLAMSIWAELVARRDRGER